ncbi:MAG TPA: oligopeptidase B, partial [Terriglobales bacterium]|nr:oligopeptidase B [Terriglobales bacterium]
MSTLLSDSPTSRDQELPQPPAAKKVPHVEVVHGERRVDDYFWLREKTNPDTPAYLEAENAYAGGVMKSSEALQKQLYDEMVGHIKETDVAAPVRDGAWWYYSRTEKGLQYPRLCRKPVSAGDAPHPRTPEEIAGEEHLYLDLNQLASGHPFLGMGATAISDDGNLLAYSVDFTGFRQYTLHVMDLRSGEVLPDMAEKVGSVAWAADNRTLFYTIEDHAKRHYRVYRHALGQTSDDLIYEDADERFNVDVSRSRSKRFLFTVSGSHTTTEARFLPATDPAGEWRVVAARRQDHEYDVEHRGGEFLIRTNDRGRNFRLVSVPVDSPGEENWKELVPHQPEVMIADLLAFKDFFVLHEREDGLPHFRITRFDSGEVHRIAFPEPVYAAFPAANREYDTRFFRYAYQSLVTPSSIYDYEVEPRTSVLIKEQEVPGYDKAQYVSERLWATAADGVRIPISIVYRKERPRDGSRPLLLTGYGAYGYAIPDNFNSNLLSLLDRGFAFAIAHIRGGGEL